MVFRLNLMINEATTTNNIFLTENYKQYSLLVGWATSGQAVGSQKLFGCLYGLFSQAQLSHQPLLGLASWKGIAISISRGQAWLGASSRLRSLRFQSLPVLPVPCVFPPSDAMLEPRRSSSPWPPAKHKQIPFDIVVPTVPFALRRQRPLPLIPRSGWEDFGSKLVHASAELGRRTNRPRRDASPRAQTS
jgi:hypothetical protein